MEGASVEYQLRLSRPNGVKYLDRFEHFVSDERALAAALAMLAPTKGQLRLEVWRDDQCIYDHAASWPFYQGNIVPFPRRETNRDSGPSRRP